ncbi:MAG: hypothetical protein V2A72_01495 [Candidatus Omnitrophota bacterium]
MEGTNPFLGPRMMTQIKKHNDDIPNPKPIASENLIRGFLKIEY